MTPAEREAFVIVGGWQVCSYEEGRRLYLCSVVSLDRLGEVEVALSEARQDIETDPTIVPICRS